MISLAAHRRVVGSFYAFGSYALGSAASSVGSTITIVGYVIAGVLTVATIVVARCRCGLLSSAPKWLSRMSKRGVWLSLNP